MLSHAHVNCLRALLLMLRQNLIYESLNHLRRAEHRKVAAVVQDPLPSGDKICGITDARVQEKKLSLTRVNVDVYGARGSSDEYVADDEIMLLQESRSVVLIVRGIEAHSAVKMIYKHRGVVCRLGAELAENLTAVGF